MYFHTHVALNNLKRKLEIVVLKMTVLQNFHVGHRLSLDCIHLADVCSLHTYYFQYFYRKQMLDLVI